MRTIRFSAALGALVGALVLAVHVVSSSAAFPGRNGLIAYASGGGEANFVLRTIKADGTQDRRLIGPTSSRGGFKRGPSRPRWSPDGKRLLFGGHTRYDQEATGLWYATASGKEITPIRLGLGDIRLFGWDWAPDGRRVVLAASPGERPSKPKIYSISLDGTHRRLLARGEGPSWSSDGRHIVFERGYTSVGGGEGNPARGSFVMRQDGSKLRRLTESPDDTDPTFSPDGHKVAYARVLTSLPIPSSERRIEWHTIGVTGRQDVTVATHYSAGAQFFYCAPQFTPDGRRLAAARTEDASGLESFVTTSTAGADERGAFTFPRNGVREETCDFSWQPR